MRVGADLLQQLASPCDDVVYSTESSSSVTCVCCQLINRKQLEVPEICYLRVLCVCCFAPVQVFDAYAHFEETVIEGKMAVASEANVDEEGQFISSTILKYSVAFLLLASACLPPILWTAINQNYSSVVCSFQWVCTLTSLVCDTIFVRCFRWNWRWVVAGSIWALDGETPSSIEQCPVAAKSSQRPRVAQTCVSLWRKAERGQCCGVVRVLGFMCCYMPTRVCPLDQKHIYECNVYHTILNTAIAKRPAVLLIERLLSWRGGGFTLHLFIVLTGPFEICC